MLYYNKFIYIVLKNVIIYRGIIINISFLNSAEYFANHFEFDTFSQIITTCKVILYIFLSKKIIN